CPTWVDRLDRIETDRGGAEREGTRSGVGRGDRYDRHRLRVQDRGGAVPSLGAGCVRRRADAERGARRIRLQSREFFYSGQSDDGWVRGRGRQRRLARARLGL